MRELPQRCDVLVIGGGPAGSTAAALLARKGYDVVLIDKKRHPRYNVGESLIPHFWKYADAIGVADEIVKDGFVQKAGGTVIWNGVVRQMTFKDFGYTRPALHVERDRFDHILLRHAGAQGARVFEEVAAIRGNLNHGADVSVLYRCGDEKTPGEIACRTIVDASGQSALVARQLGMRVIDEQFRFMSVWGYFDGSKYVALDGKAHPFEEVRTIAPTTCVSSVEGTGGWGWLWHIPMRESTSVGLVLPSELMRNVKGTEALERYFLRKCAEIPYVDRLLESAQYIPDSLHVIRDYSYKPTQLAGPGYYLLGDAAAFIEPIFSVGIVLAMYSAYIATWAIDRSLREPAKADESRAIFSSQFHGRLEVGRSLALPRYDTSAGVSHLARTAVNFERSLEHELFSVVSTLTTRSDNFSAMTDSRIDPQVKSDKIRMLETIEF